MTARDLIMKLRVLDPDTELMTWISDDGDDICLGYVDDDDDHPVQIARL